MSAHESERHILDGLWLPVMGDVLIVAGAPVTERMKSWTAVLAAGGDVALAAQTAGREFGLEQVPEPIRPQIVIPNHRDLELPGIDIHRVVPARWSVEWRRGLPLTPMPLTVRDIGATVHRDVLRDVVQHALRRRQVSFDALMRTLGRGRPGSAALRKILEEVGPGFQVKWERMVYRAVAVRGIRLKPQAKVVAPDGRTAFIDLGIEDLRYGVEIDGFLNHMARFARDRRRARMLATECEWTIAPYAVEEVAKDLAGVADDIVATIRRIQRRRGLMCRTLKRESDTLSVACPNSSSKFGEGLDSLGA
jgi:very-short-patch-repair endonuclease